MGWEGVYVGGHMYVERTTESVPFRSFRCSVGGATLQNPSRYILSGINWCSLIAPCELYGGFVRLLQSLRKHLGPCVLMT